MTEDEIKKVMELNLESLCRANDKGRGKDNPLQVSDVRWMLNNLAKTIAALTKKPA